MAIKAPIPAKPSDGVVRDPFVHKLRDITIELPSLAWLKPGLVRKIRNLNPIDQQWTLFELLCSDEELAVLDDLEPEEFEAFCTAWKTHSGVAPGES